MALTEAIKADVRRHLGYPAIGLYRLSPGGGTLGSAAAGWRFFQAYGLLEYRMNGLQPGEEAKVSGYAMGSVAMIGTQPNPGDTVSVTFSSTAISPAQTVTVTAPAYNPSVDARITLCNEIANAVSANTVLQAAGVYAATPYGSGPFAENAVPIAEVGFVSPLPFTLSTSGTGAIVPQVTSQGAYVPPTASLDGSTTLWGYIPILNGLESAFAGSSQNLDTIMAGPWKGRSNEIGQRKSLYEHWRQSFSDFLEVPINPRKTNNGRGIGAMSFA